MDDKTAPDSRLKEFWRWATTPPQAYVVYVLALILVWGISFLAGTLNPKRVPSTSPLPASTQH